MTGLIHDAPATGLLEPLTTDLSGLTSNAADFSGATQHDVSLLDTAGAIPTSLLTRSRCSSASSASRRSTAMSRMTAHSRCWADIISEPW
ncbi:hypothetical protein ACFIOY_33190 [Bradyrhizobium sp. TZ2]